MRCCLMLMLLVLGIFPASAAPPQGKAPVDAAPVSQLETACNQGDANQCAKLGEAYRDGKFGVDGIDMRLGSCRDFAFP